MQRWLVTVGIGLFMQVYNLLKRILLFIITDVNTNRGNNLYVNTSNEVTVVRGSSCHDDLICTMHLILKRN